MDRRRFEAGANTSCARQTRSEYSAPSVTDGTEMRIPGASVHFNSGDHIRQFAHHIAHIVGHSWRGLRSQETSTESAGLFGFDVDTYRAAHSPLR